MKKVAIVTILAYALTFSLAVGAQHEAGDGPRFTNGTTLARPTEYREWVFLTSNLGMTYQAPAPGSAPRPQRFTNTFVNPSSYRHFVQAGRWPDKTILVLEIRASESDAPVNKAGFFQTSRVGLEAHVKDSRFPDGWAFYGFSGDKDVAEPLAGAEVSRCVECHATHAALDNTFVQFYPTLLEVARQKGTLKQGF